MYKELLQLPFLRNVEDNIQSDKIEIVVPNLVYLICEKMLVAIKRN